MTDEESPSPYSIVCKHCGCTPPEGGIDEYVGDIVREMRRQHGWSLDELAAKLEMSAEQVQSLELGHIEVKLSMLPQLADALRIPINDLIPGPWLSRG